MTENLTFHNPTRAEKAHITLTETHAEIHTTSATGKTRTKKVKGYDFADRTQGDGVPSLWRAQVYSCRGHGKGRLHPHNPRDISTVASSRLTSVIINSAN